MRHKFSNTPPLVRVVFAVAALSATLSIGGLIDTLATRYTGLSQTQHQQTMMAKTGAGKSIEEFGGIGGRNETQG